VSARVGSSPPPGSTRLPDVPPGEVARVVEIDASASRWRERLQAYGLAPGREVEVIQHAPVTVVRVERVELAFEAGVARAIVVSACAGASASP
jgi:Fe2+ transport system protein FeoA